MYMVINLTKIYFHIDVNNAFLSWEAIYRIQKGEQIDIRNIESAIAGNPKTRTGVILAKSTKAKAMGVKTLAFTGSSGGILAAFSDIIIVVDEKETYKVQEYHLPIYHFLCSETEKYFWKE